jgi:SAM-dependent methyltransferase
MIDVRDHNRRAWDREVRDGNRWTVPISPEATARAREGDWEVLLTPNKVVPTGWFPRHPDLSGLRILGLACGGGQQGPLFAAAWAEVTVIDNSPAQLDRDRQVAEREGLAIRCVEGDMRDLSLFAAESFDLVFHPVSNCFVPDVRPVWREAFRVLRPGGSLLSGLCNPALYLFDDALAQKGELKVRHRIPYSDETSLEAHELAALLEAEEPLHYGHSLDDQLGGQLDAGFQLAGFFEDHSRDDDPTPLTTYMPAFIATRALKPIA